VEPSLVGTLVDDKYEILEILGSGGMGTVYRARQKMIQREVALKVLKGDFARDVSAVKRFFVEARAASKLRNRHSVILYDFGLSKEQLLFYTMELLKGFSLSRVLQRAESLRPDWALQVLIDVCLSLDDAHSQGIIHRDLKPDNIMLVDDGNEQIAKVLDFGIAKLLSHTDGTGLTETGMVCGTPQYMSPEQAAGRAVSVATDIYSLGVVLYEMLSGKLPFAAETPVLTLMKHINEAPQPLAKAMPDLDEEMCSLVDRMLSKDPASRPADIVALRIEIEQILEKLGGRPPGGSRIPTEIRPVPRKPTRLADKERVYPGGFASPSVRVAFEDEETEDAEDDENHLSTVVEFDGTHGEVREARSPQPGDNSKRNASAAPEMASGLMEERDFPIAAKGQWWRGRGPLLVAILALLATGIVVGLMPYWRGQGGSTSQSDEKRQLESQVPAKGEGRRQFDVPLTALPDAAAQDVRTLPAAIHGNGAERWV